MQRLIKTLKRPFVSIALAVLAGFLVSFLFLTLAGYNPFAAVGALFRGIFSRPRYIFMVIEKSVPIILTGISMAFAFRTGLFNIGAEGQYIAGGVIAVMVGILFNFPPVVQIPLIFLSAMLASAIVGGISGLLKARFGIHEVISGIMLNWIAFYFCNFIVEAGPFMLTSAGRTRSINKSGFTTLFHNFKASKEGIAAVKKHPWFADIFLKSDLNVGILVAITVAVFMVFVLKKTTLGYSLRAVGLNAEAAQFAGIGVRRNVVSAMAISGAICGLAAALMVTGVSPHAVYKLGMFENTGFNGIFVALIAQGSPIGCIFSGLFFGALRYGSGSLQKELGVPSETIDIMVGLILFFVALTSIIPILISRLEKKRGSV